MNKRRLGFTLVVACGCAAIAAPVFAQTPNANPQAAPSAVTPMPATARNKADNPRPVPAPGDRNCLRDTGSHIPPPKGQCLPVAGTSYGAREIQRTGATDVGQALQMLDPSIQVIRH
jgi:hypothetical protein